MDPSHDRRIRPHNSGNWTRDSVIADAFDEYYLMQLNSFSAAAQLYIKFKNPTWVGLKLINDLDDHSRSLKLILVGRMSLSRYGRTFRLLWNLGPSKNRDAIRHRPLDGLSVALSYVSNARHLAETRSITIFACSTSNWGRMSSTSPAITDTADLSFDRRWWLPIIADWYRICRQRNVRRPFSIFPNGY